MRGDLHITPWEEMGKDVALVLDVLDPDEVECGPVPANIRIPLNQLRDRLLGHPAVSQRVQSKKEEHA